MLMNLAVAQQLNLLVGWLSCEVGINLSFPLSKTEVSIHGSGVRPTELMRLV